MATWVPLCAQQDLAQSSWLLLEEQDQWLLLQDYLRLSHLSFLVPSSLTWDTGRVSHIVVAQIPSG